MGGHDPDPAQNQFARNNIPYNEWGANDKPLDAHLDGMSDFISNMEILAKNLHADTGRAIDPLRGITNQATGGGGFPEGLSMRATISFVTGQMRQFFASAEQGEHNVAMMMQTVKDGIGGEDSFSALSVDRAATMRAIDFATVQPGATRPPGIPPQLGQTYMDLYLKNLQRQQQSGAGAPTNPASYHETGRSLDANGKLQYVYKTDDSGNRVTVEYDASGRVVSTTYLPAQGTPYTVSESTSTAGNGDRVTTTKRVTDPFGAHPDTQTTTERTHTDGNTTTTTEYDQHGNPTSSTSTVTNPDRSTSTTHSTYDGEGHRQDGQTVTVGPEQKTPDVAPPPQKRLGLV